MGWRRAAAIVLFALMIGLAFVQVSSDFAVAQVGSKTITVDGDPSDWTGVNTNPNTGVETNSEYFWNDSVGDDTGDGDYTYPWTGDLNRTGLFDIQELRITADDENLYILIKIVNLSNTWSGSDGFSTVSAVLLIDTTLDDNGTLAAKPNVNVAAGNGWEYWMKVGQTGWHAENAKIFDEAGNWAPTVNKADETLNSIEASIPLAFIGKDGYSINSATWRFMFFLHSFDGGGPNGFRDVRAGQWCCEWQFGGGEDHDFDPQIVDLAFNASQANQEAELASYTGSSPATISSHADVTFGNVGFTPDTTSPTISNVTETPTFNSANIDWSTNEIADTTIVWGTAPGTLTNIATKDEFVTSHSVTLSSLQESTTYYYRASSYDIAANGARTSVLSFTTAAAPPSNIAAWVGNNFTWQDSAGDDVGDGDYSYPQSGLVDWFGRADIVWYNMTSTPTALHISATLNANPEAEWRQRIGTIAIFIDQDHVFDSGGRWVGLVGTGAELTDPHPMNISVAPNFAWEYLVVANFVNRSEVGDPTGIGEMLVFNSTWNAAQNRWTLIYQSTAPGLSPEPDTGQIWAQDGNQVDIFLNYSVIGTGDNWTYAVAGMLYDDAARPFEEGGIRQVRPVVGDWIGGGANGPINPNVYDLAFYPTTESQAADLSLYSPTAGANISRAVKVNFTSQSHEMLFVADLPAMEASLSVSQVAAGESAGLTVFVTNRNIPVEGAQVSLVASPAGAVDIISANPTTTNAFGAASFTVRGRHLDSDTTATLTATATVGTSEVSANPTLTVRAVTHTYGLALAVENGVLGTGEESEVTATFTDKGSPVSGATVSLTSDEGALTVLSSPATTNSQGQATFTIRAGFTESDVDATLTATATNDTTQTVETASVTVRAFEHIYELTGAADPAVVAENETTTLTFTLKDAGAAVSGGTIAISVSPGSAFEVVGDASKTTGANGRATFTLRAESVSEDTSAVVTATASNGTASNVATFEVTVVAQAAEAPAPVAGIAAEVFWAVVGVLIVIAGVFAVLWVLGRVGRPAGKEPGSE